MCSAMAVGAILNEELCDIEMAPLWHQMEQSQPILIPSCISKI
jgi:hypothetical protein